LGTCPFVAEPNLHKLNRKPLLTLARHTAWICSLLFFWANPAYAQTTDTITFNDGEQLAGKLISVLGGNVTFHSEILGNVTVPLEKVKTLNTAQPFAAVEKNQRVTRKSAVERIPVGSIALKNNSVSVSPPHAEEKSFPSSQIGSLVDAATFHREIQSESDFLYGWAGSITLGASVVDATNSAQTYTGSVALIRTIPTIAWLPPASKTTLNLSGTYGLAKNPEIISNGDIFQAASTSKTDILHGDAEWDKYLSPAIFGLVNASADHNFGNGLQLQQAYGAGIGWSIIKRPKENFDIKAILLYQQQQFYNGLESGLGTPSVNVIGADLNESWSRTFAHNVKFSEYVTLTPTFNVVRAYSAVGNANFVFPVYKKLNFTLSSTDNYLGDPPEGFRRNSFQFTAGITYVVK
jgi:Protein of unknown function, DUF481